jgi:putative endonuclease
MKQPCVYIMASRRNGTLYLGVTSNLAQRAYQHRNGLIEGFSKRYGCRILVWYAAFDDIQDARAHELGVRKWKRAWKLQAIEETNPDWRDLFEEIAHRLGSCFRRNTIEDREWQRQTST